MNVRGARVLIESRTVEQKSKSKSLAAKVVVYQSIFNHYPKDLYASAEYYFDGVWDNITQAEQGLLRTMAQRPEARYTELLEASGQAMDELDKTLGLLKRHDIILQEDTIRFASELMRDWVRMYQGE